MHKPLVSFPGVVRLLSNFDVSTCDLHPLCSQIMWVQGQVPLSEDCSCFEKCFFSPFKSHRCCFQTSGHNSEEVGHKFWPCWDQAERDLVSVCNQNSSLTSHIWFHPHRALSLSLCASSSSLVPPCHLQWLWCPGFLHRPYPGDQ